MVTASEFVLFTALRKVDVHATQHETIFLCPNYELLSFFIENYVSTMNYCRCASPTPALQLSGPELVNLAPVFLPFQFMTPLAGLCIGFAFARARLASLGYQSYVLNNLFAATLFSARIPDALHLLPLCSPPTALSHGLSLIPLAAPGCCWLLLAAGCCWLLLAAGCSLMAVGCWLLAADGCCCCRCCMAAGCWLLAAAGCCCCCCCMAAGCWLLVAGCWLLTAGCWLLLAAG